MLNKLISFIFVGLVIVSCQNINIEDIGLGIDMVKVVLNNIKGSIEITSTKNVGTEYVMKLPVVALFNNDENIC